MNKFRLQPKSLRRLVLILWFALVMALLTILMVILLAYHGYLGELPSIEQIQNPKTNLASQVISSDGKVLGTFFKENRSQTEFEEIPEAVIQALIAIEDERFYEHSGIDFKALARAIVSAGSKGGASTITQQLAKMLFTEKPSQNKFERGHQKILEWITAIKLEYTYSKQEILTMYLNKFDFLYQAVGIKSAADIYFKKNVSDLNLLESATLIGMAKNPSLFNPRRHPENAKDRRNLILSKMYEKGFLDAFGLDTLVTKPIQLSFNRKGHTYGVATYFREHIRYQAQKIINQVNASTGENYNLYRDGLKIYTTLDSRMQKNAEEAVMEHMQNLQGLFNEDQKDNPTAPFRNLTQGRIDTIIYKSLKKTDIYRTYRASVDEVEIGSVLELAKNTIRKMTVFSWHGEIDTVMSVYDSIRYYKQILHTGMIAIDPTNGHVKTWVGGIDNRYFKYDLVNQSKRQVGSLFKPFVYSTAVDRLKFSPCQKFPNIPILFKKEDWGLKEDWMPKNASEKYGGEISLKNGLAHSINTITATLMKKIGPSPIVETIKKMGVKSYIPKSPSICLGTADLTVKEMTGAFTTFVNKGRYTEPVVLTKIEDKNNVAIYRSIPKTTEVLSEETAYITIKMMEEVALTGTARRLYSNKAGGYWKNPVTGYPYDLKKPIAAKTGTTQNHSDGWFIGIVPDLVAGVWVGADERAVNFKSIYFGQGATMALPIWALFMQKNQADPTIPLSRQNFKKPRKTTIRLNCDNSTDNFTKENDSYNIDSYDF